MVCVVEVVGGYGLEELIFDGGGGFSVGDTDASCDAEDVGVDGHGGLVVENGKEDVGGFSSDAGQGLQVVSVVGEDSVVFFDDFLCHGDEVLGFVVGVGNAFDEGKQFVFLGFCEGEEIGIAFKDGGCGLIDAFVGALCGKDDCDGELVFVLVKEFGLGFGDGGFKALDYGLGFLGNGHWRHTPMTSRSSVWG